MSDNCRISGAIRDVSPCKDCTERFTACSDRCPKDARGEYGYKAWLEEVERVKKVRREYLRRAAVRWPKYWDGGNENGKE